MRIELASDVLFDFDSAQIQPKARATLARIAQFIGNSAKGQARIFGYTDPTIRRVAQRIAVSRSSFADSWSTERGLRHTRAASRLRRVL